MKLTLTLAALLFTPLASFAQETVEWPGPEWPTKSCPYAGQEVRVEARGPWDSKLGKYTGESLTVQRNADTDKVHFRWLADNAKAEVFCGELYIVLFLKHTKNSIVEVIVPYVKK